MESTPSGDWIPWAIMQGGAVVILVALHKRWLYLASYVDLLWKIIAERDQRIEKRDATIERLQAELDARNQSGARLTSEVRTATEQEAPR